MHKKPHPKGKIMTLNKMATGLLFAVVLIFSGCGSSGSSSTAPVQPAEPGNPTVPAEPGNPAVVDSTTITTIHGEAIQVDKTAGGFIFHGYEGKIVLLEVYGDTCPHCVASIPVLNGLQAKYPDDVVVIALESYGTLTNASKQQYITIPKANTGNMFLFIKSLTGYSMNAVPYLMVLDRNGDYVYDDLISGDFPLSTIEGLIQGLL